MSKLIYIFFYSVLTSIAIGLFMIYRPFAYVDNVKSYIICDKNKARYEIGPNLIYTFNNSLDRFNDQKARKLCEYGLIKDYADTLKTPQKPNYIFYPIYNTESSWLNAVEAGIYTFIVLAFLIELTKKVIL